MTQASQSMTNRTLSGLFWMSLATGANVFALLLVLVVLARLLTPADFGQAAAALMVIGFSAIFAELGIGPAIVQRQDLQPTHVRTGFTLAVGLGVLFCGLSWVAAPVTAGLFGLEELTPILRLLSLVFPVQGLGIVAESLLQRELRFRCLAGLDAVAVVLGYGMVGIALAYLGFAAWALVGAYLAQTCLRTVLLLIFRPHPAWPLLNRRACADLVGFGGGFTAGRFSNYVAGQGENLVIGGWLGPVALGVYGRAYQLMAGPAVLFGNVLDRVLFPAMAHVQDQPKRLADAYRRGSALIALVILPVSAIVVALAPEVIQVVLGPEWEAVTLPLQILGVGMLFRTGCKISDSLVRATGAVHRRTWRQTAYAILVVAGAWVGQHWGIEGVAVAVLATLALNFLLMAHLSLCLIGMSWRTFAAAHSAGLGLAAVVGVPVVVTAELLRSWNSAPLAILALSATAILPSLIAVACLPGIFLGQDGQWIARKLIALIFSPERTATLVPHVSFPSLAPGAGRDHPLTLLTRGLAAESVRYCRWKSRIDLSRLLSGEGDLDFLVDCNDAETFLHVAEGLGFKRVVGCFEPNLVHEMHLYGPDQMTGVLLHLHVNFYLLGLTISPLPTGGEGLGVRELAWPQQGLEELVLRNSSSAESTGLLEGMPVVQPGAELIVFVLRAMDQYARLSEFPRLFAGREILQTKLQVLLTADADGSWRALLERWLPGVPLSLFTDCLEALRQRTSWARRFLLARKLQKAQEKEREKRRSGEAENGKRTTLWGISEGPNPLLPFFRSPFLPFRPWPSPFRQAWWRLCHGRGNPKQLPTGGVVVAFIGPDASGKSTMVAETTRWLGQVFRVQVAHLGKPPSTWLTWLPNFAGRLLGLVAPRMRTFHQSPRREGLSSGGQGLLYRLRAVLLAWDRRALAIRLSRKAAHGWIIVCDRYPTEVVGAPDSARLRAPEDEAGLTWLQAFLARLESRLYREIPHPDVLIRLTAPLGVAIDRNRERVKAGKEGDDFVERRHKDFFVPKFADAQIIELDTSTSQAESVHALYRLLWDWLCRPHQPEAQATGVGNRSQSPLLALGAGSTRGDSIEEG
jgi:O-antigen/teichoic acid export membrane protein/thymidylate kinase